MKTLNNHIILFDAECPVCRAATRAIVASGIIENEGNVAYQAEPETCFLVDKQRAVNEIALIDQTTGEVKYGIESLFKVLGVAMPVLNPLLQFKPFIGLMRKVYGFFTYNRRVILPVKLTGAYILQPTFKLQYRLIYILFTWLITALILTGYVHLMYPLLPIGNAYREYIICGGQLFFQAAVFAFVNKGRLWDYLGNLMTISFAGAQALLPVLLLAKWVMLNPIIYVLYFLMIAGLMFLEHIRRAKLLELGWALTISWACYRILVLVFIFLTN